MSKKYIVLLSKQKFIALFSEKRQVAYIRARVFIRVNTVFIILELLLYLSGYKTGFFSPLE